MVGDDMGRGSGAGLRLVAAGIGDLLVRSEDMLLKLNPVLCLHILIADLLLLWSLSCDRLIFHLFIHGPCVLRVQWIGPCQLLDVHVLTFARYSLYQPLHSPFCWLFVGRVVCSVVLGKA